MVSRRFIRNTLFGAAVAGVVGGIGYLGKTQTELVDRKYKRSKEYYDVTYQWIVNKQKGMEITDYFAEHRIKTIAIYGMGTLGELLYNDIKEDSAVGVSCFIDQMADLYSAGIDDIPVLKDVSEDYKDQIDAVVITPVHQFDNIKKELEGQGVDKAIISLKEIINCLDE
ncbi:hypothetical protein D7V86_00930 [bacterium D16-51]|nr:hypothetical protein D7V96_04390 [bacterium D16-59]RKI62797.1 hypothetical protein D7V86_00930 [bacterium D16-51]